MEEINAFSERNLYCVKILSQIRNVCFNVTNKRAAISVAANIAEGMGRNYKKDTVQFLHIARGSLYELETLLMIAQMLEMLKEQF